MIAQVPMKRIGQAKEVAEVMGFLKEGKSILQVKQSLLMVV